MTISPAQCRAARAMLGWSREKAAQAADVAQRTIVDFEREARSPHTATIKALQSAFESVGVEFTNGDAPGVRLQKK